MIYIERAVVGMAEPEPLEYCAPGYPVGSFQVWTCNDALRQVAEQNGGWFVMGGGIQGKTVGSDASSEQPVDLSVMDILAIVEEHL
ncbi:hypothetical protein ABJI51_05180 [Amycolatopsis sp. NEAU-NG30]|uniref:Uncharacterized protein n=1 Tax=Amycolatopsis melonis TaxID=3156488 RepID=A0ABV0L822_9PSEU